MLAAPSVGLLLLGSGVSVHLEEYGEIALEEATAFVERVQRAVEEKTARRVVVDDPLWPDCQERSRCIDAIRARTDTEDVVLLRLFSGPTKIRLIAERLSLDSARDSRIERNIPKEPEAWPTQAADISTALFPETGAARAERIVDTSVADEGVTVMAVLPWVSIGISAAALGVGAGFGFSSRGARNALTGDAPLEDQEFRDTFDRMQTHGRVANGLFVTSAVALVVGGVLLMFR